MPNSNEWLMYSKTQSEEGMDSYVTLKITSVNHVSSGKLCLALFECQYFCTVAYISMKFYMQVPLKCNGILKKFCVCVIIIYPVNHRVYKSLDRPSYTKCAGHLDQMLKVKPMECNYKRI